MNACRSCGAAIEWAVTENGKRMPVDAEPVEHGTILLRHLKFGEPPVADVVTTEEHTQLEREQAARDSVDPVRLFVSHFATCPDRRQWRRDKPATEEAGKPQKGGGQSVAR